MSIHKLTAGSGYDYLTRQVAALDATDKGHVGLASYYTARGETPGQWIGSGMTGIEGLAVGDVVTAEQMQALYGSGHHPLAEQRREALVGPGLTDRDLQAVTRLGAPYKVYSPDVSSFRIEVAVRVAAVNEAAGLPGDWPVPAQERSRIRTEVAREFFRAEHGRDPADARELAATIARHSRPRTTAVAGFDVTFSPVKSVSTLWAISEPATAARVEVAHQAAVRDALAFLESHALYTRTGTNGVRQVDVKGMVATAFTHRDSRAGDPDLHTHVAIANKVQTVDGRWLSIDGRILFKATVAASETYNTALERHLRDGLGVQFEVRTDSDPRKRPVREIVGVDPALNTRWSARRARIEVRRSELAAGFQASHGRPPTPVESLQLAQQATLETREAKHEPRSLAEQRVTWHAQARDVLGGEEKVQAMLDRALAPAVSTGAIADAAWFETAAGRVLSAMEARRSTWQTWHVRAEAQRQVRGAQVPTGEVDRVVDALIREVLDTRSVSPARPEAGITEPMLLRRADGASVYTVAGADLHTSVRVLEAEARLVAMAGRADGRVVDAAAVDLTLLESTANGVELNAGQAALVREMATSGARLQLAIAPAGAGKTTAMRALAGAWAEGGGTVIGLAPSAAAAAALREQIDARTDTLAKLTWSLQAGDVPEWAEKIGPSTLVVIDEAGMADTLSLDAAVGYVVARGGSVRLIGDDQQLAAIGAGGVLRDIKASHGALQLSELLRFSDPAEGAASLAVREGQVEALGFYLDHDRVHVGDLATMTEDVFTAWLADRGKGLDAIMLAPTRELVSELNQRARAHRLSAGTAGPADLDRPVAVLADGNYASVGELVITRTNDRGLRTSATDWVKNGDRWSVLDVHAGGALTVQHTQNGRTLRLPPAYVAASTELGYATTVHTAQGVSADTMHGLASGQESRQQLYTMMTRGRLGNHVYLEVVGDGDPHTVIHPELLRPLTATDLLEGVLARDDAPRSATTLLREQDDPAAQLGQATARYVDALYVAAEAAAGAERVATLSTSAEQVVPGLTEQPAWPALRAHLLLLGAHGQDPLRALTSAAAEQELGTAVDTAAVLDWRLDDTGLRNAGPGPLPWLPAVPAALRQDPQWGGYLTARCERVVELAGQVRARAAQTDTTLAWVQQGTAPPGADVVGDVEVWRAAVQVPAQDRRPTGAPLLAKAAATYQRQLDRGLTQRSLAVEEWAPLISQLAPGARDDEFSVVLAERLAAISRAGINARGMLRAAAAAGTLPDDHAAAALWWRISRHLSPAVTAEIDRDHTLSTTWGPKLAELVGADRFEDLQSSPWWPALVTTVSHGLQRGWALEDLIGSAPSDDTDLDLCQAMVWRASVAMDPVPDEPEDPYEPSDEVLVDDPCDLWEGIDASPVGTPHTENGQAVGALRDVEVSGAAATDDAVTVVDSDNDDVVVVVVESQLALAAMLREVVGPLDRTDAEVARMLERAVAWEDSPVTRERMVEVNQMTLAFFEAEFTPTSWGRPYLAERFGHDLTADPRFRPGQAPPGWIGLVTHLRRQGVSDSEMIAAGVATTASTGRVIDRFRDRVVFPVLHHDEVLGFVGRRRPELSDDDKAGPKYLNTADTALFHKGAQLFVAGAEHLSAGGVPVSVEGPMDAIAVTLATRGTHVGVTALGTSLTEDQAAQLGALGRNPIVATDADLAGQVAAERHFWMLTPHGLDPTLARFPDGMDPAGLLAHRGPAALIAALASARPLGQALVEERLANLAPEQAQRAAARVLAAQPAARWDTGTSRISDRLRVSVARVRRDLRDAVRTWDRDPHRAAQGPLRDLGDVRSRLSAAAALRPEQRWAPLALELDPRLIQQGDWPALAAMMAAAHTAGNDVTAATHTLVAQAPLGELPAQDLRYRLVSHFDIDIDHLGDSAIPPPASSTASRDRKQSQTSKPQPTVRRR